MTKKIETPRGLRLVAAMVLPDVSPAPLSAPPEVIWVDPLTLCVDETYQRNLSERSLALIRRIVAGWNWAAFKPPIVVREGNALHVIDGQHTAIAAATHGAIGMIPVLLVEAAETGARARAFVAHNVNRVAVTPGNIHRALVAAGDEDAVTLEQVAARAGCRILVTPPWDGGYAPGDIVAIGSMKALVKRRHAQGARRVLDVCVAAKLAPISAAAIKAVETLLFDKSWVDSIDPLRVAAALRELGPTIERDAKLFAAQKGCLQWQGMVAVLARQARARRRGLSEQSDAA